jgi:rfaE bifunctional protein nucleotidyltransferase chain/domain
MAFTADLDNFLKEHLGHRVVFTNGCFDIIHPGHVCYLKEARSLGDVLVVGINSDASVKRLKGDSRPVNNELDRKIVLENLKSVDFVEIFTEDTPLNLILKIRPHILAKGGDWKVSDIVGGKEVVSWGGEVKSLQLVPQKSTSNIIAKILQL